MTDFDYYAPTYIAFGRGKESRAGELVRRFGPDSLVGRTAAVMIGSSETTFYATAMYFGCVGVKKIRHTLVAAIAADLTAMVMSALLVKLFFG